MAKGLSKQKLSSGILFPLFPNLFELNSSIAGAHSCHIFDVYLCTSGALEVEQIAVFFEDPGIFLESSGLATWTEKTISVLS